MTQIEFSQLLASSPYRQQFESIKLLLNYPHIKFTESLEGASKIFSFIDSQVSGFSSFGNLGTIMTENKRVFEQARQTVIDLVRGNEFGESTWQNRLYQIVNNRFTFNHPITDFLNSLEIFNPIYAREALTYFGNQSLGSLGSKDSFIGYLMAYSFEFGSLSDIPNWSDSELATIGKVRESVQNVATEINASLTKHITEANEKVKEFETSVDKLEKDKRDEFNKWFAETKQNLDVFNKDASDKLRNKEELYNQKLRLEPAAMYWNKRAAVLHKEGKRWLNWLLASIGFSAAILTVILICIGNGVIATIFKDVGTAVKWSIVLVTLVSFLAFGVRVLSRLVFSSYHLARDAEEREQLAYVFLAMSNETKLDETQRNLITQALFSRSDSGLLREESSPTMPGNIIDKVTQKN